MKSIVSRALPSIPDATLLVLGEGPERAKLEALAGELGVSDRVLMPGYVGNPDPIIRDNIMLSAYLAEQINAFEAATGSTRFDEPGALTFVWKDGRTFPYDHRTIVEAVKHNFESNELGFFPCEPGV